MIQIHKDHKYIENPKKQSDCVLKSATKQDT